MQNKIHVLPDLVANQIAAGEVVQRPASVVKELLENSIDAQADEIVVNIKDAGKSLIQIIDNGCGMSELDARLCLERHATSKIASVDDIFKILTMGFRGEALASIAAVSQMELKTKTEDAELCTEIKASGGEVTIQDASMGKTGTSISIKNIFFNVPARRNFLKSHNIETRHILEAFQQVALSYPAVSFKLYNNGNETYNLEKSNFKQRIIHLFGKRFNERLIPVEEKTEIINITGFITKPEFATAKRSEQFFQVNNRFIKSPYFHHAVMVGYEDVLPKDTYPQYFIKFEVDPNQIDVNIHPTKTEIKFLEERAIYAILRTIVRQSLGKHNIAPSLDFGRETAFDLPDMSKEKMVRMPQIKVDPKFNPFDTNTEFSNSPPIERKIPTENAESLYDFKLESKKEPDDLRPSKLNLENRNDSVIRSKIIQLHNKFILTHIKSGFMVIDQHRAHQRILFEQFLLNKRKNLPSQQLLFPVLLELSKIEMNLVNEMMTSIEKIGFSVEIFGKESLSINGSPPGIKENDIKGVFLGMLEGFSHDEKDKESGVYNKLAKSLAAKMAIKAGQNLGEKEMENLVDRLFACDMPYSLPNGKPIVVTLPIEELNKRFHY